RSAAYRYVTTALLDNPIDHGKTQPSSFAALLGCKKWFEDVLLRLMVHANAVVGDGKHNITAGFHQRVTRWLVYIQFNVGGFNGLAAAIGHGIARVDSQVHHHLFELAAVHLHTAQLGSSDDLSLNFLAYEMRQHVAQLGEQGVQIEHYRFQYLLA